MSRIHPDAFVPVGTETVVEGDDGGAGTYKTGSIDISDAAGIYAQSSTSWTFFSFVTATDITSKGLLLSADSNPQLVWFDPVASPTLYYAIHNNAHLRYLLVRPATGRRD